MGERLSERDKSKPPKDITKDKQSPKVPGMHRIALRLYLRVRPSGGAFWCLRYTNEGKVAEMGLGSLESLSLAEAKVKVASLRLGLKKHGIEPRQAKKKREVELLSAPSRGI